MKLSKVSLIGILCLIALSVIVPISASTPLTITAFNLYGLNSMPGYAYHDEGYLYWSYFGENLVASYSRGCGGDTQFADNYGYYWGECVSAVKALSGSNVVTANWIKGSQVTSGGVAPGTAIATFSGESYYGHTAIFKGYIYSGYTIIGIEVWDQNWRYDGLFMKHIINCYGSGVSNANNYYVVEV